MVGVPKSASKFVFVWIFQFSISIFDLNLNHKFNFADYYFTSKICIAYKLIDTTIHSKIAPPSPPQNLRPTDVTGRSITLQWEPPVSNGGSELTGTILLR